MDAETAVYVHTVKTETKEGKQVVCSAVPHELLSILMIWFSCLLSEHSKNNLCCKLDVYIVQTVQWKNTGS